MPELTVADVLAANPESVCPVTGEFCPHLNMLSQQQKDSEVRIEDSAPIPVDAELAYVLNVVAMEPEHRRRVIDTVSELALKFPEYCRQSDVDSCGVITRTIGPEGNIY